MLNLCNNLCMNRIVGFLFVFSFVLCACTERVNERDELPGRKEIEETLIGTNRLLLEVDEHDINDFVDRHGWELKSTGSGLRYEIFYKGSGSIAMPGSIAIINYEISLLSGHYVYSSKEGGEKAFRIGRGGVESGLEEGILLMSVGDKARFIMPPHLAHGFPGDGDMIPKRATIVYNVELIGLE